MGFLLTWPPFPRVSWTAPAVKIHFKHSLQEPRLHPHSDWLPISPHSVYFSYRLIISHCSSLHFWKAGDWSLQKQGGGIFLHISLQQLQRHRHLQGLRGCLQMAERVLVAFLADSVNEGGDQVALSVLWTLGSPSSTNWILAPREYFTSLLSLHCRDLYNRWKQDLKT